MLSADLSDFFWLKRGLPAHRLQADPFDPTNPLTPKRREAVQDETKRDNGRPNDPAWFEETMAKAYAEAAKCFERTWSALWFLLTRQERWEAHLPELRFALGEPELDTTTIDNAAFTREGSLLLRRKTGSNGFRIGYQPTIKKVVSDWRASLDEGTEVKNRLKQFRRIATRYEKTARAYLSMLCIAAARLWIKTVNTA